MTTRNQSWAIVLAAGEGSRLRELTTASGIATPKQFCSLRGGRSLLGDALARAARIVPRKRIVVVVAEEHQRFWERDLAGFPAENIVVQPRNRGTAAGILLPALAVLERDPEARLAFLPSDHFVAKEYVLESALRLALESLDETDGSLTLLGITPDSPESGYGWIVPAASNRLLRPVERFVEKPEPRTTLELFAAGALWNSFLFAVDGRALLRLYREHLPKMLDAFHHAYAATDARSTHLAALYATLEASDFSRDLLQGERERLRLEIVPPCGWTDLGTPARVAACLAAFRVEPLLRQATLLPESRAALDLAQAFTQFAVTSGAAALPA
jgi:mannose-1-phosphate guanylyltransferase